MVAKDNYTDCRDIQLFGDEPRNFTSPSLRAESIYSFLNRSSHPETARVRNMLQRWVERLPHKSRLEFVPRMRHKGNGSKENDRDFNAAFFELFLHEFLVGTGGLIEVEPSIGRGRPDFRLREKRQDGTLLEYIVEATDIDIEKGSELERDRNELWVFDSLNEILSADFYLDLKTEGKLRSRPERRKVKGPFEKLIEEADYEELVECIRIHGYNRDVLPFRQVRHDEWLLTGWLVPVRPEYRPKSDNLISICPARGGGALDDIGKTKHRLEEKAGQHKGVDNLIIALRCSPINNRIDEALFGRHGAGLKRQNPTPHPSCPTELFGNRRKDGFWLNSSGPLKQRVIGVAVFRELSPWSIVESKAVFYPNPYLEKPMPAWTKTISHADYSDGDVRIVEGVPVTAFVRDFEDVGNLFG